MSSWLRVIRILTFALLILKGQSFTETNYVEETEKSTGEHG